MSDKTDHWLRIADNDVKVAKTMLKTKQYLYVGFFCHLIVEKALKAVIAERTNGVPPKIHILTRLAELGGLVDELSDAQRNLLGMLTPLHIDGRYEEYKDTIKKTLTPEICKNLILEVEEFLCMVKKKLGR